MALDLAIAAQPASPTSPAELGEVFTRRWVVEMVLDLAGYTPDRDLADLVAVEPSCGEGAFLIPMVERLLVSATRHGRSASELAGALQAFDLSAVNVERTRKLVVECLADASVELTDAEQLAQSWVVCDDFLLAGPEEQVDFVVGNPPYIRLENVPTERSDAYRRASPAMRGRSDVYVGFVERGLRLLSPGGALAYIVADRWMHNQYGAGLRRLIGESYSMETVVEMHEVDAFEERVSAYPAVTVIRKAPQGSAVLARGSSSFGERDAKDLTAWSAARRDDSTVTSAYSAARLPSWFPGDELWPSGDPAVLALVRDIEQRCPPLQDPTTGTRVGIGVATGADSVYLTTDANLIEPDRLLPLVMAKDTVSGRIEWSGVHLVNPWCNNRLVQLEEYPRLHRYLEANAETVRARYVAKDKRAGWFRTIDRVEDGLRERPKLLIPELKAAAHPVIDDGGFYPHHNMYFVLSEAWDLEVLGGLLLSRLANLIVGAYCVKMRGGCYRFQAQYLRKIRVPALTSVVPGDRRALSQAFRERDVETATSIAARLYGLGSSVVPSLRAPSPGRRPFGSDDD